MALYPTLSSANITGTDQILVYVAGNMPIFTPLLLLTVFAVITLSTWYGTKKMSGYGDFFTSAAAGGYITTIIAVLLTLIPGMINLYTLTTCVVISIIMTIFLFFSRER